MYIYIYMYTHIKRRIRTAYRLDTHTHTHKWTHQTMHFRCIAHKNRALRHAPRANLGMRRLCLRPCLHTLRPRTVHVKKWIGVQNECVLICFIWMVACVCIHCSCISLRCPVFMFSHTCTVHSWPVTNKETHTRPKSLCSLCVYTRLVGTETNRACLHMYECMCMSKAYIRMHGYIHSREQQSRGESKINQHILYIYMYIHTSMHIYKRPLQNSNQSQTHTHIYIYIHMDGCWYLVSSHTRKLSLLFAYNEPRLGLHATHISESERTRLYMNI
jgi:hypothetical protein